MLSIIEPLEPLTAEAEICQATERYIAFENCLKQLYPCSHAIGVGTIIFYVDHPSKGLLKIHQHIIPDKHQAEFILETFENYHWFYEFHTMEELLDELS